MVGTSLFLWKRKFKFSMISFLKTELTICQLFLPCTSVKHRNLLGIQTTWAVQKIRITCYWKINQIWSLPRKEFKYQMLWNDRHMPIMLRSCVCKCVCTHIHIHTCGSVGLFYSQLGVFLCFAGWHQVPKLTQTIIFNFPSQSKEHKSDPN